MTGASGGATSGVDTGGGRVVVVGAGPSGLTAARTLALAGVPVLLCEAADGPGTLSRASTFHPPTLDLLDHLGVAADLVAAGRPAGRVQYRDRALGVMADFDLSALAGATGFPFRLQVEQRELTRLLDRALAGQPGVQRRYRTPVTGVRVRAGRVVATLAGGGEVAGAALIGADGAHSVVRSSLGIAFEGETYPMRYLTVACPVEFDALLPGLAPVSYVSGGGEGVGLLALRDHWRAVFRVPPGESDADALSAGAIARRLGGVLPAEHAPYPVADAFIYRVHRRVAATFRHGPVLLVGDAAHVNSPSGGMGMNSGIHDAYLAARALVAVLRGGAGEDVLRGYAEGRRRVAREVVGARSDRNYRDIVESDLAARRRRRDELAAIAADPAATLRHLARMSMLDSAPTLPGRPPRGGTG